MRNKCHFFNPCSDLKVADARTRLPTQTQRGNDKEVVNKLEHCEDGISWVQISSRV